MNLVRIGTHIVNLDHVADVLYEDGPPPKLQVFFAASESDLRFKGDAAVELMALLCNRCTQHIGPDLSLYCSADNPEGERDGDFQES